MYKVASSSSAALFQMDEDGKEIGRSDLYGNNKRKAEKYHIYRPEAGSDGALCYPPLILHIKYGCRSEKNRPSCKLVIQGGGRSSAGSPKHAKYFYYIYIHDPL